MQGHAGSRSGAGRPLRAWVIGACALVALAAPSMHGQERAGTIAGHVTLTSRMRGVPISTNAYAPRGVNRQQPPASPEMRNVVVYLKGVAPGGALPVTHVQIRQEHESFSPRVVAVTRGSTVDFPNFDPYFHNVFSLSGAGTFDLGRYPEGQTRTRQFTKPGIVKVYCHIHSHMSATIVVLDHPYFATPDDRGTFALNGVPPGEYTLVGWHERVGEQSSRITIHAGQTVSADISLPVETDR